MRGRLERRISRRPAGRSVSRTTSPRLSLLRARRVARLLRRAELDGASGLLQRAGLLATFLWWAQLRPPAYPTWQSHPQRQQRFDPVLEIASGGYLVVQFLSLPSCFT